MLPSHAVGRPARLAHPADRRRDGDGVRGGAERGAVLVHAAVAMMGLLAFSALTVDMGSLWVARAQAQNAADAGALAGGVALAYGDPTDTPAALSAAATIAQQHQIWGQNVAPASLQTTTGTCPAGSPAAPGACLQVRVSRNAASGTPLPVFFSRLFGVNATDVTASAWAKVLAGNASSCVRPLAIMDRWNDSTAGWQLDDHFAPPDTYVPPSPSDSGSGHTRDEINTGLLVRLGRADINATPKQPAGNEYFNLDIPRADSPSGGGNYEQRYRDNITSCNGVSVEIGASVGYFDAVHTDTIEPAEALINADSGAYWDGTAVRGSDPRFRGVSPRLLTIALVDPQEYLDQTGPPTLQYRVRNLIGFFLIRTYGDYSLEGVLLPNSGTFNPSGDTVAPESSFLQTVALVR